MRLQHEVYLFSELSTSSYIKLFIKGLIYTDKKYLIDKENLTTI